MASEGMDAWWVRCAGIPAKTDVASNPAGGSASAGPNGQLARIAATLLAVAELVGSAAAGWIEAASVVAGTSLASGAQQLVQTLDLASATAPQR